MNSVDSRMFEDLVARVDPDVLVEAMDIVEAVLARLQAEGRTLDPPEEVARMVAEIYAERAKP